MRTRWSTLECPGVPSDYQAAPRLLNASKEREVAIYSPPAANSAANHSTSPERRSVAAVIDTADARAIIVGGCVGAQRCVPLQYYSTPWRLDP